MSMSFNPKKVAHDIANGLVQLNPVALKRYMPGDLKVLLSHLLQVQRETRATLIPQEDIMALKRKNQHMQHIHNAITMINSYVKKQRLRL